MNAWTGQLLASVALVASGTAAAQPHVLLDVVDSLSASSSLAPTAAAVVQDTSAEAAPAPVSADPYVLEPVELDSPLAQRGDAPDDSREDRRGGEADGADVDADLAGFVQGADASVSSPLGVTSTGSGASTGSATPGAPAAPAAPAPTGGAPVPAPRGTGGPASFGLASFNILGAAHTAPGADADHFAHWRMRAEWTGRYIQDRDLDIVGLQEASAPQLGAIMRATRNEYAAWPGTELPRRAVNTSLIWRKDTFEALTRETITNDFMMYQQPVPVVRLRHRATGRTFWVMNVHNAPRALEAQRDVATAKEIARINEIRRSGEQVFFIGDMNERDETACKVFAETDLVSPAGGSNNGRCILPANRRVDWIFGPRDVTWSGYTLDRSQLVKQSTDHFVPQVRVTLS